MFGLNRRDWEAFFAICSGGMMFGSVMAAVAVYIVLSSLNTNCAKFGSESTCSSLRHSDCLWVNGTCLWDDFAVFNCSAQVTPDQCQDISECAFDYDDDVCEHSVGWSPIATGLFAGGGILGGLFGPFIASLLIPKWNFRMTFLMMGIVCIVSSLLGTVSRLENSYWTLIVSRVLHGVAGGGASTAAALYATSMSERYGTLFSSLQLFWVCLVYALGALYGVIFYPRTRDGDDVNMEWRIHGLLLMQWVISFFAVAVAIVMRNPPKEGAAEKEDRREQYLEEIPSTTHFASSNAEPVAQDVGQPQIYSPDTTLPPSEAEAVPGEVPVQEPENDVAGDDVGRGKGRRHTCFYLFVGFMLTTSQQWTGIPAMVAYGPSMVEEAGLDPLLGYFIACALTPVGSLMAIPLVPRYSHRKIYLWGLVVCAVAAAMAGLGTHPNVGISPKWLSQACVFIGMILFTLSFSMALSPFVFTLGQSLFPPELRRIGLAWCLVIMNFQNLIINLLFPVAVQGISGGRSGNQKIGVGVMFFVFAVADVLCCIVLFFTLFEFLPAKQSEGTSTPETLGRRDSGVQLTSMQDCESPR